MNEKQPGLALVAALREECQRQGKHISHLASPLGLAPTYWAAICNGVRSIRPLTEKKAACRVFADFLRLPSITVMSLAEIVLPEDFVVEQSLADQLNSIYLQMSADPLWSTIVPKPVAWDEADEGMKLLIVSLYQANVQQSMFEKVREVPAHSHLVLREGLTPAPDQLTKWGMPVRAAAM